MFRRILFITFVPFALLVGGSAASADTCGLLAPCPTPPEPQPPAEPKPPAPQPPAPAPTPNPEQRLLELMNRERAEAGAPPLVWRDDVAGFAEEHSARMAREGRIWHNDEYFSAESRRRFGAKTVGENVALNKSIDDAHQRLMNSPGHRANILNGKFTEVGVGVVKNGNGEHFITEAFVEPNGPRPAQTDPKVTTAPKTGGTTASPAAPLRSSAPARASSPTSNKVTAPAASTTVAPAAAEEAPIEQAAAEGGLEPQVLGRTSSDEAHDTPPAPSAPRPATPASRGTALPALAGASMLAAALAALVMSARSRRAPAPAFAASTRGA